MFLAFLKSPIYKICVDWTIRKESKRRMATCDSDDEDYGKNGYLTDDELISSSDDEEKQLRLSDFYCIEYNKQDTQIKYHIKNCINYSAAGLFAIIHFFIFYVIISLNYDSFSR